MVFFCCNGCGETLKKQKVDQHPFSCRSSVSCIDCNINFSGNEYKKHTQCVSEAQRYQGHLYDGKENKGALKQNSWMESVRSAAEACKNNAQLKGLLIRIAENDNVPRKKAKFLNFIKNSMRVGNKILVEKAWEEIEKAGKPPSEISNQGVSESATPEIIDKVDNANPNNVNGTESNNDTPIANGSSPSKKERKKRKRLVSQESVNDSLDNNKEPKLAPKSKKKKPRSEKLADSSTQILHQNLNHVNSGVTTETPGKTSSLVKLIQDLVFDKGDISVKKLKRKVTTAYMESKPHKSPEEIGKLFDKKLTRIPGVAVEQGRAMKESLDISLSAQ